MKALYREMVAIAESSPAPLFTAFKDDLYKHDKDVVMHDLVAGDTWYFAVKECGTYFVLADKDSEYVQTLTSTNKYAPERRHFLISIGNNKEYSIKEYKMENIAKAIGSVKINPNRKAPRQFAHALITSLASELKGSVLFSDFMAEKGDVLYLSVDSYSASYLCSNGQYRVVGLPFDPLREPSVQKLTVTSDFGHAVMKPIKKWAFVRAVKANNDRVTADL